MSEYFTTIPDENLRPLINAEQLFASYAQARDAAKKYSGNMSWQAGPTGTRYLVSAKMTNGIRQKKSFGAESSKTRMIFERYQTEQSDAKLRSLALEQSYARQVRMNRALGLGSAPPIIVKVLKELDLASLTKKVLVIGTNSIFAYASAARVMVSEDIAATDDLDLLWDSRSRMKLVSPDPQGLLGIIKKADSSFVKMEGQGYTITNDRGYQVDLIKRNEGFQSNEEPYQIWENDADFWATKTNNMDWLLSSPRFSRPVMATNGEMAMMHTVDPRAFVLFKYWLSERPERDPGKAIRDKLQAKAIQDLVEQWLPNLPFPEMVSFPISVRDRVAASKQS